MNANLPILKSLKTTVIRSKDTWATAIGVEPKTPVIDYFDTVNTTVLDDIATELNAQCGSIGAAVKVIATIPAKNEQESIYECLESFSKQRNLYGQKLDEFLYHIIVLCHDCTDSTIEECERFALEYPDVGLSVLSISHHSVNNVGAVRRIAMQLAYEKLNDSRGFIGMTDADTVLHPLWISNILGYYNSDYGLICGKILTDIGHSNTSVAKFLRWKETYCELRMEMENSFAPIPWDPIPKHADNSGPNMAVRAEVYKSIGGIAPLGFCEDVRFYDTIVRQGQKVRHCPMTIAITSTRTLARAPWGFGAELGTWQMKAESSPEVEGFEALKTRYSINAAIMRCMKNPDVKNLGPIVEMSGIEATQLSHYLESGGSWVSVVHHIEKHLDNSKQWRERFPLLPIREACKQLDAYFHSV